MWWINTEIPEQKWHYAEEYPKQAPCGACQGIFFTVVNDLQDRTLFKERPVCEMCLEIVTCCDDLLCEDCLES